MTDHLKQSESLLHNEEWHLWHEDFQRTWTQFQLYAACEIEEFEAMKPRLLERLRKDFLNHREEFYTPWEKNDYAYIEESFYRGIHKEHGEYRPIETVAEVEWKAYLRKREISQDIEIADMIGVGSEDYVERRRVIEERIERVKCRWIAKIKGENLESERPAKGIASTTAASIAVAVTPAKPEVLEVTRKPKRDLKALGQILREANTETVKSGQELPQAGLTRQPAPINNLVTPQNHSPWPLSQAEKARDEAEKPALEFMEELRMRQIKRKVEKLIELKAAELTRGFWARFRESEYQQTVKSYRACAKDSDVNKLFGPVLTAADYREILELADERLE